MSYNIRYKEKDISSGTKYSECDHVTGLQLLFNNYIKLYFLFTYYSYIIFLIRE